MAKAYEIRDRDIGGILDQAIYLFRDHFKFIATVTGLLVLPFVLGMGLLAVVFQPDEDVFGTETGMPDEAQMEAFAGLWAFFMASNLVLSLLGAVGASLADASIIHGIGHRYLGSAPPIRDSLLTGVRLLPKMLVLYVLVQVIISIGVCMCIVPGLIFMAMFFLFPPVLVLESAKMSDALSRSARLVRGFVWQTMALIFVVGLIGGGLQGIAFAVPSQIVIYVLYAVAQTGYIAFLSVVRTSLYFAARCRLESLDLDLLADAVDVPPAAEAAL